MQKIEFIPIRLSNADVYSIKIDNDTYSEYQKFLIQFKDTDDEYILDDLQRIVETVEEMARYCVFERLFRPEGSFSDRVCAIPLQIIPRNIDKHGTLRVYCIRISDRLLIIGGGGE